MDSLGPRFSHREGHAALFQTIDAYCERTDPGYWAEPVNALTNLAFLLAALIAWRRSAGLPGARALAVIRNRNYVLPQDIFDIAPEVMRHRLVLSYEALARDITADHVVAGILATVPAPRVAPSQEPTYGSSAAG